MTIESDKVKGRLATDETRMEHRLGRRKADPIQPRIKTDEHGWGIQKSCKALHGKEGEQNRRTECAPYLERFTGAEAACENYRDLSDIIEGFIAFYRTDQGRIIAFSRFLSGGTFFRREFRE